jgi:hypothetical protein
MPPRLARSRPAAADPEQRQAATARRRTARRLRSLLWRTRYLAAAACCAVAAALVVQALRPAPPPTVGVVVPTSTLVAGHQVGPELVERQELVLVGVLKIVGRIAHLIAEAQCPENDASIVGAEHDRALAPRKDQAGYADHALLSHRVANDGERLFANLVVGRHVVG